MQYDHEFSVGSVCRTLPNVIIPLPDDSLIGTRNCGSFAQFVSAQPDAIFSLTLLTPVIDLKGPVVGATGKI